MIRVHARLLARWLRGRRAQLSKHRHPLMTSRKRYLVAYDVADDKRRNQVFRTLSGYGDRAQYSVFFCEVNPRELAELRGKLHRTIHDSEDQVMILEAGCGHTTARNRSPMSWKTLSTGNNGIRCMIRAAEWCPSARRRSCSLTTRGLSHDDAAHEPVRARAYNDLSITSEKAFISQRVVERSVSAFMRTRPH